MSELDLFVVERVSGTLSYHIARADKRALCGSPDVMMHTSIPLSAWGTQPYRRERWCAWCKYYADAEPRSQ